MKFIKDFINYLKWLYSEDKEGNKVPVIWPSDAIEYDDIEIYATYGKVIAVEYSIPKVNRKINSNTLRMEMFFCEDMKFIMLNDGRVIVGVKDDRSFQFVKKEYGIFGLEPYIFKNIDDINLGSIVRFYKERETIELIQSIDERRINFGDHLRLYDTNKENLIKWASKFGGVQQKNYFYTLGFVPIENIFNQYMLNRIDGYTVNFVTVNGIKKLNEIENLSKYKYSDYYAKISRMSEYTELGNEIKHHIERERNLRKKQSEISELFLKISRAESGFNSLSMMKYYGNDVKDAKDRVLLAIADYVNLYIFNELHDVYGSVEEFIRRHTAESAFAYVSEHVTVSQTFENLMYFAELNTEYYELLLDVEKGMSEFYDTVNSLTSLLEDDTEQLKKLDRVIDLGKVVGDDTLKIVENVTDENTGEGVAFREFVTSVKQDKDLMRNAMIEDLVKVYELSVEQGNGFRLGEIELYMRKLVDAERAKNSETNKFSEVEKLINETLDTLKFYNI